MASAPKPRAQAALENRVNNLEELLARLSVSGVFLHIAGGLEMTGALNVIGGLIVISDDIATADPHVANQVWSNAGVLTISAG